MMGFPVAAATVALADRLTQLIGDRVPGAQVTMRNPGLESLRGGDPAVNVYLFRTIRNGYVSNDDLPTRSAAGRPLASPVLRLDLDYMITFYGDDARLDPQRLLGLVAGGLYAEPYIGSEALRASMASTPWLGGGSDAELTGEALRVAPMNMAPDALARLWSEFVNIPYQLTQLYTVSAVSLRTPLPTEPVPPVRRIGVETRPAASLAITAIVNAADPALPLAGGGRMGVRMANPGQQNLVVHLNGVAATGVKPGFDAEGFAVLLVDLTADQPGLRGTGPLSVRIVRSRSDGAGILSRSRDVLTEVRPAFAHPPTVADGQIAATMTMPVAADAAARMLLFPHGGAEERPRGLPPIPCLPRTGPTPGLKAPLAGVPAGRYMIQAEIDGLTTWPDVAQDAFVGPIVDVPATA